VVLILIRSFRQRVDRASSKEATAAIFAGGLNDAATNLRQELIWVVELSPKKQPLRFEVL
jgi:hypothetical protein